MNLDCERCRLVYSAILKNGGASWPNEIARDTGIYRRSVKRHLGHLLEKELVERDGIGIYWIKSKETTHVIEEDKRE